MMLSTANYWMNECLVAQSYLTLCDSMNCSLSGSSVHGILQARILEWVAIPSSTQGFNPGLLHCMQSFYQLSYQGSPIIESEVAQSCLTLCDTMDCNLPGSSVDGIFQARVLEWVAISFSRGSSRPRNWTRVSCNAGRPFTVWATKEAHY